MEEPGAVVGGDLEGDVARQQDELLTRACAWWDEAVEKVKERLNQRDQEMQEAYQRRHKGERDVRVELVPSQHVLLKQRIPGKL